MNEVWESIIGYEGLYEVSTLGKVRSLKRTTTNGRILNTNNLRNGYPCVTLSKNGIHVTKTCHRLVAETFIPNPKNLPQVNHKDGNKMNNCVHNLEWVSSIENVAHARRLGLARSIFNNPLRSTPVNQYSLDGELIATYPSMGEAQRITGTRHGNISKCCSGKTPTAGGYKWAYATELLKLEVAE